eukprot:TRINITY_DN28935_c0_g1_i2.p2 TRINITY_DN28935_c0_g1~~TRINITY_DN28935_c0_g1_i2.p2  ORF type:complete len:204 (-),score=-5.78 TRINITY_DN28935_c0_g1_i2:127-705(-)
MYKYNVNNSDFIVQLHCLILYKFIQNVKCRLKFIKYNKLEIFHRNQVNIIQKKLQNQNNYNNQQINSKYQNFFFLNRFFLRCIWQQAFIKHCCFLTRIDFFCVFCDQDFESFCFFAWKFLCLKFLRFNIQFIIALKFLQIFAVNSVVGIENLSQKQRNILVLTLYSVFFNSFWRGLFCFFIRPIIYQNSPWL